MFYEFSIQYDDPIVTHLARTFPLSVSYAYPNYFNFQSPMDTDKLLPSYEFLNLNYHRYIHLFHTFLPNDSIQSPHESFSSSIVRLLSPLVPQGNWTNGGSPPQPTDFFYRSFPKQSPDFDNDYHSQNPSVFWGWFQLSRWLPNLIQRVLFPLDDVIYNKEEDSGFTVESNALPPRARKLSGNQTPTKLECSLCEQFKGHTIWDRNGVWYCIYDDKINDIPDEDQYGRKYFKSFNSYRQWKHEFDENITNLEKMAYQAENMNEMHEIENEINQLNSLKTKSHWIRSKYIVSVKG